jgi:acylphosphatase
MHRRITVNFKGRVQGVGFRWRVMRVAKLFPCTGYVKNLTDGSVELVIEGAGSDANRMVDAVNREMQDYWNEQTTDERLGDAHFSTFEIKY